MIVQRSIYAGDTPLFSDFSVAQTGPMQLTISGGTFQITGQARIVPGVKVPAEFFNDGRAELLPDGKRARVWLQDRVTKRIKDKSKRRKVTGNTLLNVTAHPNKDKYYKVDLRSPSDVVMQVQTKNWLADQDEPITNDLTHILIFPFKVVPGTTDLSGIDIEVFTVLPGFPDKSAEWEV